MSDFVLDEFVGWYVVNGRDTTLLTWGAEGGLVLFGMRDTLFANRFLPLGDDRFRRTHGADSSALVRFARDDGTVAAFEPVEPAGTWSAPRIRGPYSMREVRFRSDSLVLAGTVFTPSGEGPHPGVVMIHGSGASSRDNSWYMSIVDALARRGIVVLLPDKRGSGQSRGDWETAGFDDFVADARAGAALLRADSRVDPRRIGYVGISQGGRIAPMAASDSIAFVVNVSGAAVPLGEQLRHETTQDLRRSSWPRFLHPLVRSVTIRSVTRRRPEWWDAHGALDPLPSWEALAVPGLVVYGSEDEYDNVPVARSVERLRALGKPSLTIQVYQGSGHGLYEPGRLRIRSDFLEFLTDWVHSAGQGQ